jgi:hypothetical protein
LVAASAAHAEPPRGDCPVTLGDWSIEHGGLRAGLGCGVFFGTTDGWSGPFSYGHYLYKTPVTAPYAIEVTWQRLGSDGGEPLELVLLGSILLMRDGQWGLYTYSEPDFHWRPLPGFRSHRRSAVRVEQHATRILVWVDGVPAVDVAFAAPALTGQVGVRFKGSSSFRSRMWFRDFSVQGLGDGQPPSASASRSK